MLKLNSEFRGVVLLEVLIGIALFITISLSLHNLILNSFRTAKFSLIKIEALNIANQKMEQIRSLSYEKIGTVQSIPEGDINSFENFSGIYGKYEINTSITYFDDPNDQIAPADLENQD